MILGETHWNLDPDVRRVAERITRLWPASAWNTYEDHPWPGWDGRSVDFWGRGGRGDPIPYHTGRAIINYALSRRRGPQLRHAIYLHTLWTESGGVSRWIADDHSGRLRHVHLTFQK